MTIAACHVSIEGVVLGADSATTLINGPHGTCHFDYAQKLFEVGPPGSSAGLVWWGIDRIGTMSHRTLVAELGDVHRHAPFSSMEAMAEGLRDLLEKRTAQAYPEWIDPARRLDEKVRTGRATSEEAEKHRAMKEATSGGYCLAGRVAPWGPCAAYELLWSIFDCSLRPVALDAPAFWGVPHIMERLVYGLDVVTLDHVLASGKWSGSWEDLQEIVTKNQMISPRLLPIREAIDWVHTIIHTTIRVAKFANWPHIVGGPVEVAAITTDRPFRWVRHKPLDAAIITTEEARQ